MTRQPFLFCLFFYYYLIFFIITKLSFLSRVIKQKIPRINHKKLDLRLRKMSIIIIYLLWIRYSNKETGTDYIGYCTK